MAAISEVTKGSLSPTKTHRTIITEFKKAERFLKQKKELATSSLDSLPGSKNEKIVFKSQVGSELNVDQKGKAALSHIAALIKLQVKQAGNSLPKEMKTLLEAQAEAAEATGQFLEVFAKGSSSMEQAFKKKNGWFWGYTVIDRLIRSTLTIAEKGGKANIAIENIKALEEFKEIPVVNAALSKNAEKISKLKSIAEDPRTAAFQELSEGDEREALKEKDRAKFDALRGLPPQEQAAAA